MTGAGISLRTKLIIALAAMALIPLFLANLMTLRIAEQAIIKVVFEKDRNLAENIAGNIDNMFAEKIRMMKIAADNTDIRSMDADRMVPALSHIPTNHPALLMAIVLAPNGDLLARSDGKPPDNANYSDREYFRTATRTGQVTISDVLVSKTTGNLDIGIAEPIKNQDQTLRGMLVIGVSLQKIIDRIAETRIGTAGYAYVVNKNGKVIMHADRSLIDNSADFSGLPPVKAAMDGQTGWMEYEFHGSKMLAGYSYVPTTGWGLIVHQPLADALAVATKLRITNILIMVVTVLVAVVIAFALAGNIFKPVALLTNGAKRVAEGDLETQANFESSDEIGTLAAAFNYMTKQLRARETALYQSQEQLSEALRMARAGHWEYDVSKDLFTFNDNFYRIFRTTAKEVGGYQMSSAEYAQRFCHPEDMPLVAEETRLAIETTNPEYSRLIEHRILFTDGEVGHIAVRFFVVKNEVGHTIQTYGVNQDITERQRMEESLRKSETKFRTVANHIHDWEYWSAPDESLIFVSLSCEEVTGYTAEEFVQDPGLLQKIIHRNDLNDFILHLKNLTPQPNPESCRLLEFRILTKNGEERWIAHSCRAVYDDQGHFLGRRISNQDITLRKRTEQEKEKIQEQLMQAQKMEAIGTLAGGIAHDFNNILGAILGYAEMAYEDSLSGSVKPKDLNQVLLASHRAKDLVKQILAFSRQAEAHKIPMRPVAMVKESIKLLRSSLPTTIDIQQDIDPETNLILADPTQIHQIVMNLCTNAYHAMEETGGIVFISLKNKDLTQQDLVSAPDVQPGHFIQLSIRDTGSGIPPEIRKKIFDPYFTTKEAAKGTGMGLAIVHGIAKSYGGFITCHSEIGAGTVFEIYLPAISEQIEPESKEIEMIPVGTEHILFIDDEEMLAEMGKTMLERLGYRVTVETNSIEALNIIQHQPDHFDLIITDQTMPGMTGSDLARRILQIRPELPIILCTGFSNQISEEKARIYGIKGFAMKPLAKKDLASLIRKVLDGE